MGAIGFNCLDINRNQILKLFSLNIVKIYQMLKFNLKLFKESAAQMYSDSSVTFCLSNVSCAFPKVVTHGQYGTRYSNAGHVLQVSLENAYLL